MKDLKMRNNIDELIYTIKKLSKNKFSDLPEDLIIKIIKIENEYIDDRIEANKRIEMVVEIYLNKKRGETNA